MVACRSNGFFLAMLEYAGYDAVIVQNKAEKLAYLHIHDGKDSIGDASGLAGKGAFATESWLRKKYGEENRSSRISIVAIGPAGENRERFACPTRQKKHKNTRCAEATPPAR